MLLITCNYTPLLRLSCPIPLELGGSYPGAATFWAQVLGLDLGAGRRAHISKTGPCFARLRCFVVPTVHSVPQLVLALRWIFLRLINPQKSPQTDTYPAPGRGQQLDH